MLLHRQFVDPRVTPPVAVRSSPFQSLYLGSLASNIIGMVGNAPVVRRCSAYTNRIVVAIQTTEAGQLLLVQQFCHPAMLHDLINTMSCAVRDVFAGRVGLSL